jgi:hypothetical protein
MTQQYAIDAKPYCIHGIFFFGVGIKFTFAQLKEKYELLFQKRSPDPFFHAFYF